MESKAWNARIVYAMAILGLMGLVCCVAQVADAASFSGSVEEDEWVLFDITVTTAEGYMEVEVNWGSVDDDIDLMLYDPTGDVADWAEDYDTASESMTTYISYSGVYTLMVQGYTMDAPVSFTGTCSHPIQRSMNEIKGTASEGQELTIPLNVNVANKPIFVMLCWDDWSADADFELYDAENNKINPYESYSEIMETGAIYVVETTGEYVFRGNFTSLSDSSLEYTGYSNFPAGSGSGGGGDDKSSFLGGTTGIIIIAVVVILVVVGIVGAIMMRRRSTEEAPPEAGVMAYEQPMGMEQPPMAPYAQPPMEQPMQPQYAQPPMEQPMQPQYGQPPVEQPMQPLYDQPPVEQPGYPQQPEQPMQPQYAQPPMEQPMQPQYDQPPVEQPGYPQPPEQPMQTQYPQQQPAPDYVQPQAPPVAPVQQPVAPAQPAQAPAASFCRSCGAPLDPASQFCTGCGAPR